MALLLILPANALARPAGFQPGCTLPYAEIQEPHPIDQSCDLDGSATQASHKAQNRSKNNFCAPDPPVTIKFSHLTKLQKAVDTAGISYGSSNSLPSDRSVLQHLGVMAGSTDLGEGTQVRIVAFVTHAKNSNVSSGRA